MGKHDAFGLAGGAGSIDDRGELAWEHLCHTDTVGRDFRRSGGSNQGLITQKFRGASIARTGSNYLLHMLQLISDPAQFFELSRSGDENNLGAAVVQDIDHAVRGFVEIDGHGNGAGAADGEVGGMPFRAIGGEQADAIAGFNTEFSEGSGQSGYTTEKLLGRDGFPAIAAAKHLRARRGVFVDSMKKAGRQRTVAHAISTVLQKKKRRNGRYRAKSGFSKVYSPGRKLR